MSEIVEIDGRRVTGRFVINMSSATIVEIRRAKITITRVKDFTISWGSVGR